MPYIAKEMNDNLLEFEVCGPPIFGPVYPVVVYPIAPYDQSTNIDGENIEDDGHFDPIGDIND